MEYFDKQSSAVEREEDSKDNPNCLTPKEDIYQIITDLMKDDVGCFCAPSAIGSIR